MTNPFLQVLNALGWTVSPTHEDHRWAYLLLQYGAAEFAKSITGVLTGAYLYKVTFVTPDGETSGGTESASVSPAAQAVQVTIPTGPAGTIERKIYRTSVGGATGTEKYLATVPDNTTTSYLDNAPDSALGAAVPASNSTTVTPPTAPTVAVGAAGVLTGAYLYKVTFVDQFGETSGGTESASVSPSAQQVNLTAIPTGPAGIVTARKIYRTAAGGTTGTEKYVGTIGDNTTTVYTDNLPDGTLGAAVPATNTTTVAPPAAPTVAATAASEVPTYTDPFKEVLRRMSAWKGRAYTKLAQMLTPRIQ